MRIDKVFQLGLFVKRHRLFFGAFSFGVALLKPAKKSFVNTPWPSLNG